MIISGKELSGAYEFAQVVQILHFNPEVFQGIPDRFGDPFHGIGDRAIKV